MNILILSKQQLKKRNWGRELFKRDISKFHNVTYVGPGYNTLNSFSVPQIIKNLNVDFILTYCYSYTSIFTDFNKVNIPKIHIEPDYVLSKNSYPGTSSVQNPFYIKSKFDLIFAPTTDSVNDMISNNISKNIRLLPFSVCTDIYKKLNTEKFFDVMSVFLVKDNLYPNRRQLQNLLHSLKDLSVFTKSVTHHSYIQKINESKIFITSNNIYKSLNMKYTEVLSCGTFLLADKPNDLEKFGYKDGEHLVIYKNFNDLKDKIYYFLKNEKEREEIAKNGMNFVRQNHSNNKRIEEMTDIIKNNIGGII